MAWALISCVTALTSASHHTFFYAEHTESTNSLFLSPKVAKKIMISMSQISGRIQLVLRAGTIPFHEHLLTEKELEDVSITETMKSGPPEDPPEAPPKDLPEGPPEPRPKPDLANPKAHPVQNPSPARAGPGFGNLGTWKTRNLESKKISQMEILKIQIHVAPNVSKVWIGRKKTSGAIPGHFLQGPKKCKTS